MATEQKIVRAKIGQLELAKQRGNVRQACKWASVTASLSQSLFAPSDRPLRASVWGRHEAANDAILNSERPNEVRRARPQLLKPDQYERHAACPRDRSLRAIFKERKLCLKPLVVTSLNLQNDQNFLLASCLGLLAVLRSHPLT
jgi:hypothetical protein